MVFSQKGLLTDNLFEQVLLDPARGSHGRHLLIVSGYATASMANWHMSVLQEEGLNVSISLIVGMVQSTGGISEAQHIAFKNLVAKKPYGIDFECRYVQRVAGVHSKTYLWLDQDKNGFQAFCGSANYSVNGFSAHQIESMVSSDPLTTESFYRRIQGFSTSCHEITIRDVPKLVRPVKQDQNRDSVTLSFITRSGQPGRKSGLNWGQRKGRNPDQAYIPIPATIRKSNFFPPLGDQFTVLSDDGESFIFVRAQQEGKALHTTLDNSRIGRYIRNRIGVPSGTFVTRDHLEKYGRTDIRFTKIDDETYLMDFSL